MKLKIFASIIEKVDFKKHKCYYLIKAVNMYKLIAADFDNTLCNSKKEVTARTREIIKRFQNNGGMFVIATTRPYFAINKIAKDIGLDSYIIASQGASIRSLDDDSFLYKNFFTHAETKEILQFLDDNSCRQFLLFSDDAIYLPQKNIFYERFKKEMPDNTLLISRSEAVNTDKEIAQIMVGSLFEKSLFKKMEKWRQLFEKQYDLGMCDRHVMNFVRKGVSKGNAVEILAAKYGISKAEIMTFGDSENDKSLFEYSGLGVAMANSMDALKEKADTVCGDCDNDGLAEFIENNAF